MAEARLIGRDGERDRIAGMLGRAAAGNGGAVVLAGEAGVGKSSLLDLVAAGRPAGMTLLRVTGVEVEAELAHVGLATLVAQAAAAIDGLDAPSAGALRAAVGLGGDQPVGLALHMAVLTLLSRIGSQAPVLLALDDVQWIDPESLALFTFAARRVAHDSVAVVLAGRPAPDVAPLLAGIERLELAPLGPGEAVALLGAHGVVEAVARRCWAATGGNPLALVELAAALGPDERTGRRPLPDPIPVAGPIRAVFARRLAAVEATARRALAVAAIEATGDASIVAKALAAAGLDARDLRAAAESGFVEIAATEVRWEHPLARAAILDASSPADVRAAHLAVATALADAGEGGRVAFHLAAAADGPDAAVADRLEEVAHLSTSRGAMRAAASAWDAAADLSPDDDSRAARRLAGIEARWLAGETEAVLRAGRPLVAAEPDPLRRARLAVPVGQAVLWWEGPAAGARYLTAEADRVGGVDAVLAGYLDLYAAQSHLLALDPRAVVDAASRAGAHGLAAGDVGVSFMAQALEGLGRLLVGEADTADRMLAPLTDMCPALLGAQVEGASAMAQVLSFAHIAAERWDAARELIVGVIAEGERTGHVGMTTLAHDQLGELEWRQGRWAEAAARITHALTLAEGQDQDQPLVHQGRLRLARIDAVRGRTAAARPVATVALEVGRRTGWRSLVIWAHEVLALAADADGGPGDALPHTEALSVISADQGIRHPGVLWWQAAHVEALAAVGRTADAHRALDTLRSDAAAAGGRWPVAAVARGEAVLAADPARAAERLDEAVDLLAGLGAGFDLALTLLARARLHGSAARAAGRGAGAAAHADAAAHDLGEAHARFVQLDARPWADRAAQAARLDDPARPPRPPAPPVLAATLTDAEMRVALAVGGGASNREAADQLFLSVKTVDSHLQSIYRRLSIRSRSQLAALVARELGPAG